MPETAEFGRVCLGCGTKNQPDAQQCANCGRDLESGAETSSTIDADDPRLQHVDFSNRVELDRFERLDQAELACGLLRSNGIACELSNLPLPGLPADIILSVGKCGRCQARLGFAG